MKYDGKFASRWRAKSPDALCAVLPQDFQRDFLLCCAQFRQQVRKSGDRNAYYLLHQIFGCLRRDMQLSRCRKEQKKEYLFKSRHNNPVITLGVHHVILLLNKYSFSRIPSSNLRLLLLYHIPTDLSSLFSNFLEKNRNGSNSGESKPFCFSILF